MNFEWATFRQQAHQGYSQIQGTLNNGNLSIRISKWSDVPAGTTMDALPPYIWAGRAFNKQYVFIRSEVDEEKGRGAGYLSRAIILPLEQAMQVPSLAGVFQLLSLPQNEWEDLGETAPLDESPSILPTALALINAYEARGRNGVALLGPHDTPAVLSSFWSLLWPQARAELSFKTYSSHNSVPFSRPEALPQLIISVERNNEQTWSDEGYAAVTQVTRPKTTPLSQHLSGTEQPHFGPLLESSAGGLSIVASLTALQLQLQAALNEPMPDKIRVALKTLDTTQLNASIQKDYREQLEQALMKHGPHLQPEEVIRLEKFEPVPKAALKTLKTWASVKGLTTGGIGQLLNERRPPWFLAAVQEGLQEIQPSPEQAIQIWKQWPVLHQSEVLDYFLRPEWEEALVATYPDVSPLNVHDLALQRGLYRLYLCVVQQWPSQQALQDIMQHLPAEEQPHAWTTLAQAWGSPALLKSVAEFGHQELDSTALTLLNDQPELMNGVRPGQSAWQRWWLSRVREGKAASEGISDTETLIQCLAELNDASFDEIPLALLNEQPELMNGVRPEQPAWQRWWLNRLNQGSSVWEGIREPEIQLPALLALKADQQLQPLLSAIAKTPQANLLTLERPEGFWAQLPSQFLAATAKAWFTEHSDMEVEDKVIEAATRFISHSMEKRSALALLTALMTRNIKVTPSHMEQLLKAVRQDSVEQLTGPLQEYARRERLVDDWYTQQNTGNFNLGPDFFEPLFDSLNPLNKVRYLNRLGWEVEEDLWWTAVKFKATLVSPTDLEVIWNDIRGKRKHLQKGGTFQERWYDAIDRIRDKGSPSVGALLQRLGEEDRTSDDTTLLWETRPDQGE